MKITFHGAAQEVTGSCTMIETEKTRFLVDCGMFQGGREADARNRAPFTFDPRAISFVLLTHAHIDHSGLLPKLWRNGFRGPIYTTSATAGLLEIMLRDSAHIQESDAGRAKRNRRRAATDPVYTMADAEAALGQLHALNYDVPVRASVHTLGGFSAHADQAALLDWLGAFKHPPSRTFVMHGEPQSAAALANETTRRLGWSAQTPQKGETIVVAPGEAEGRLQ